MKIPFTKMEGAGNDYIYFDATKYEINDPSSLAKRLSDRHFGIGGDGIILICPSKTADFKMRMFNFDGSEAQMCGNGIRCVGKYVYDHKMVKGLEISIETLGGIKYLDLFPDTNDIITHVRVDMGKPIFAPSDIPVTLGGADCFGRIITSDKRNWEINCMNIGNPHAVILVGDAMNFPVNIFGPGLEVHSVFPEKCNIEFITVIDRKNIDMRVWERGSGETLACGTGACASAVACIKLGLCEEKVAVKLRGGTLIIEWDKENSIFMTGPATYVFTGEVEI